MKIFKFGGASVKDAEGVKNLAVCFTNGWVVKTHWWWFRPWEKQPMPSKKLLKIILKIPKNYKAVIQEVEKYHNDYFNGLVCNRESRRYLQM